MGKKQETEEPRRTETPVLPDWRTRELPGLIKEWFLSLPWWARHPIEAIGMLAGMVAFIATIAGLVVFVDEREARTEDRTARAEEREQRAHDRRIDDWQLLGGEHHSPSIRLEALVRLSAKEEVLDFSMLLQTRLR